MDRATRIRIFSVLFLSIFSALLGLGIIIPILPVFARSETIGASGFWVGAIFAGFSLARAFFMPIVGKLSDRRGRKGFITMGLCIYALSSLGYIYSHSVSSLLFVRILQGFCSAMIVPIAMAYVGDIAPKDKEGTFLGVFTVSLFLGFGFGPLLGGVIQDLYSVNAAFGIMGILCGLAFVLVLIWLPPSSGKQVPQRGSPASFSEILGRPQIRGILCYRFVNAFTRACVLTFLPLYASYTIDMSGSEIGVIISAGVLLTSFMQVPCGRLADMINRKTLIITGNILYSLAILFFPFTYSFTQVLILNLILGILGAVSIPAASAIVVDEGKHYGMGSTMAVFNVAMSLGLGTGPLLAGLIHDFAGLDAVFFVAAVFGILGTLMAGHFLSSSPPPPRPGEHPIVEDA